MEIDSMTLSIAVQILALVIQIALFVYIMRTYRRIFKAIEQSQAQ